MKNIKSRLFNIFELTLIIAIGLLMNISIQQIVFLFVIFIVVRKNCQKPMHYKSPWLCLLWTTLIFISFYILTYVNPVIAILGSGFAALVATGKADAKDTFMYNSKDNSKYREMKKYIEDCKDKKIIEEFEKRLKKIEINYKDRFKYSYYEIYKLYFFKGSSFKDIKEELNMYDNHEVTEALDIIFMIFNTYMIEINEFDKLKENKELATKS